MNLPMITQYHAHVYFDEATVEQAVELCGWAAASFDITMGRVHRRPVGPHSRWSCLLTFDAELFGELVPWLNLQREGLNVFIHPCSGNDLDDHTRYMMWLGDNQPLKIDQFL